MNSVDVPVWSGSDADRHLISLLDSDPWPFKAPGLDWPHALITAYETRWGITTYTITQVHMVNL